MAEADRQAAETTPEQIVAGVSELRNMAQSIFAGMIETHSAKTMFWLGRSVVCFDEFLASYQDDLDAESAKTKRKSEGDDVDSRA